MSSDEDVIFQCHNGGEFGVVDGKKITYVGGSTLTLESKPESVVTNLMAALDDPLCGQKIWYKYPFEDFSELKLINEGENFQKMCTTAVWVKSIEIFLEKEQHELLEAGSYGDDRDGAHSDRDGSIGDDRDGAHSDRDGSHGDDRDARRVFVDMEGRVEKNLAGFVDEEEHDNDEDTPPNSDCKDVERRYMRCKKGSGEIKLEQVFDSIGEFKEVVVDYALKNGENIKFTRWGSEKSEVRCSIGGNCKFKIYCSYEDKIGKYMVKTCNDVHACTKDGFSKVIKSGVLAQLFLNDIRKDPTFNAKAMQDAIEERYTIVATYDQCRTARAKALKMIQEEYDEQFARLHDYMEHLLESNPGSTAEVGTLTDDAGIVRFDRFYVCFEALRKTWLAYCRPIIGIDGCFLKNGVKGQLLATVGRDANNQFYPVAWAVVQTENYDAWLWFIKKLKVDLKLEDGDGFTLISDRQKGLLNVVDQELPKVEHRMCARHIYGNLRRVYPGKDLPKKLFWAVAKSFNASEYNKSIDELKKFDEGVYEAVMQRNPRNCSRAFFGCKSSCEDVSNNFSESYNNAINKAREMPLVEMLETIRRQTMMRIDVRLKKSMKRQGKYTLKVANTIKEEELLRKYCQVIPCGNGQYEVLENKHGFKVDMNAKTCACRRWSMTGIPCRHVLRVILTKKHNPEDYVNCDWYLASTNVKIYSESISAINGIGFWIRSQEPRIQPPPREVTKGPKKTEKRKKGKNESPKKKSKGKEEQEQPEKRIKVSKAGRDSRCGRCSTVGHNTRSCPALGVVGRRWKKKKTGEEPSQGQSQEPSQGQSQEPSQRQSQGLSQAPTQGPSHGME